VPGAVDRAAITAGRAIDAITETHLIVPRRGMSRAVCDVIAERHRRITCGYGSPEVDDLERSGSFASAAACYAISAIDPPATFALLASRWPWERARWNPGPERRMLVDAVVLLLAEIERRDRAIERRDRAAAREAAP
jgi:hypothetical protein